MKFCKDCEHYRPLMMVGILCKRPLSEEVDPVQGVVTKLNSEHASDERRPRGLIFGRNRCGPDAIHFTPRATPTQEELGREIYDRNRTEFGSALKVAHEISKRNFAKKHYETKE